MNFQPFLLFTVLLLSLSACEIDEQFDPNGPSLSSVLNNASETELNLLATGVEAGIRNGYAGYVVGSGTIARELYIFDADPRNTEDLLGKEDLVLDNNTFYITGPFNASYATVKNVNIMLEALQNTDAVTDSEKAGYRGFGNTIKALMLSRVLDMLGSNGIRVDVADPDNLGPFLSEADSYAALLTLLDDAYADLQNADFAFTLSGGFVNDRVPEDDFSTPERFARFNRAVAARVATHAARYQEALNYVNESFLNLDGDLTVGPQMIFSTAAGDQLNPLFKTPGQSGDQIIVQPDIIANATPGDTRLNKFALRVEATSQDGLNGNYETALYPSATSPIDIIRNEELVLIYAEANINLGNLEEGVAALNVVRNNAGLDDYAGTVSQEALIDELLYQRTYSLWGEGHRMFDLRRYGRLNAEYLSIDREGDDIFTQFPIPLSEGV